MLVMPTGMDRLSSNQWSLGANAVGLTMPGHWVVGALISNMWSIGGYDDAQDVNFFTAQYFVNYNMKNGWYLSSAPVITANWEADSENRWTIPIGGGVGKIFKIGQQPINSQISAYYNVEKPDFGADWQLRLQLQFLFPK